ncbi:MAG: proprotein convertase P-domain-containing protein [Saprospirales bacterium]|nr:proprotein convertase P-domain-containing protein [Saprospirales bacterium]
MPDNFQGNFLIQVQNAANPTLGQNGQGVCGVVLNFDHEYIGDLLITLTSPAGQTITLIGPVGLFGETDGSSWNITFVPCNEPANPDPGFSATWSNNQNWGLLGAYTGSYYPYLGCLENFNTGPVNGQWVLTVVDAQGNDMGNFYDYSIIFCDPANILCFSCEANAGNLLQPDVALCAGDPQLQLNLPPTYTPPQAPPPASAYSYTYAIATSGVLTGYEDGPDLSAYPAGSYTVCGLSYLTAALGNLPPPDGSLTITQLAAQLNSNAPPFCGKITSNCVNVTILDNPPDIEDFATICAPECMEYYGQFFCTSGDHVVMLEQDGCPYTATLHLAVQQPVFRSVSETICAGACAQTPGFETYCDPGPHTQTFTGPNGCDSVVVLNLTVLNPVAAILPPAVLSCGQSTVALEGAGSTPPGAGTTYHWSAANGGQLIGPVNQINAMAGNAGAYALQVCRLAPLVVCCDTATANVQASQNPPAAPGMIAGPATVCPGQNAGWNVPMLNGVQYLWSAPPGVSVQTGQGTAAISMSWNINSGGMVCVTAMNACGASTPACLDVALATAPAAPQTPQGDTLVCAGDTVFYTLPAAPGTAAVLWLIPPGLNIIQGQNTDSLQVVWTQPGASAICAALINTCDTSAYACLNVQVDAPPGAPAIKGPDSLCIGGIAAYEAGPMPGITAYLWKVTGGTILGKSDTSHIKVAWNATAVVGQVCAQALHACGPGAGQCMDVAILPPPAPNAGPDTAVCGNAVGLRAKPNAPSSQGFWQALSGPGAVVFADSASTITLATVAQAGDYTLRWVENGVFCTGSDTVRIIFLALPTAGPAVPVCDPANENYTVQFPVTGGMPPYHVNGQSVNGNLYLSWPIPSDSAYHFQILDAQGCASPPVQGVHSCTCTTSIGPMNGQLFGSVCRRQRTSCLTNGYFPGWQ